MDATTIALLVAGLVFGLEKTGLLPMRRPSVADANEELALASRTIERLTSERNRAAGERDRLAKERSLEPILAAIHGVLETQQQTLEKLANFNGSLRHVEEGLRDASEGMKALTGTIAELHGIPLHPPKES